MLLQGLFPLMKIAEMAFFCLPHKLSLIGFQRHRLCEAFPV